MPAPRWLARFKLRVTNRILGPLAKRLSGMGIVIHYGKANASPGPHTGDVLQTWQRFCHCTHVWTRIWVQNVLAQGTCNFETQGHTLRLLNPYLFHDRQRSLTPMPHRMILGMLSVSDFLELTIGG